jgi:hypothetical protein
MMVKLLNGQRIALDPPAPVLASVLLMLASVTLEPPPDPALPPALEKGMYAGLESELHDASHAPTVIAARESVVFMSSPKREPTGLDAHQPVQITPRCCNVVAW